MHLKICVLLKIFQSDHGVLRLLENWLSFCPSNYFQVIINMSQVPIQLSHEGLGNYTTSILDDRKKWNLDDNFL